jgi:hypothetical protein
MRNLYICIILIISFLSANNRGIAQTWRLLESGTVLKGPGQEILPLPGGGIVTITHPQPGKKGPMTICRFDEQLIEVYSRRLNLLSRERYQSAWFHNDTLLLFTTDVAGGLTRYQVDIDNGSLTGQPLPLTGLLGIDQPLKQATFYSGGSADSGYHYIVSATPRDLRGILLDRQGEKVSLLHHPLPSSSTGPIAFTQSDDGTLALIYTTRDKGPADHYIVTTIDPDGTSSSFGLAGLPDDRIHNASWTMEGGTLCFTGWMSETGAAGLTTILTGCVDLGTGIVFGLHQTEVKTLLTKAPASTKPQTAAPASTKPPTDLSLLRSLPLPDGCRYLIFESSGRHLYQPRFSNATQNPLSALGHSGAFTSLSPSTQAVSYLSRGDVYVLKLDAANEPQWLNVLSKNQEEWNKITAIGVGSLLDHENRLHIFFYDNKLNGDATATDVAPFRADDPESFGFACISITPGGIMKKQFIPPADNRYRLMPALAFVDNKDEACFLAVRSKQILSTQYKVGTIALQ